MMLFIRETVYAISLAFIWIYIFFNFISVWAVKRHAKKIIFKWTAIISKKIAYFASNI